jgi:hypothetical protein
MTDFFKGVIAGVVTSAILSGLITAFWFFHARDKELIEYVEKQNEIQSIREDYGNRDPYEFLDDVPGARGAADNAADEFRRKRDEAVQRIRDGYAD